MSLRRSTFRFLLILAALGLSELLTGSVRAQSQQPTRKIELSEPASKETANDLNQLAAKQDGRKRLEEDLLKPRHLFPDSSLDGVFVPPMQAPSKPSAIPSKRMQEQLERRKNWVFMSPDDLTSAPTPEELLGVPEYDQDGLEKKSLSPLERYYKSLEREQQAAKKKSQADRSNKRPGAHDDSAFLDDSKGSSGDVSESELALKRLLQSDPAQAGLASGRGTFSDIFGLGSTERTPDQTSAHKKYMDEYQQ